MLKTGLLLPHFGDGASRTKLVDFAPTIEGLGFDSVWVRDHLVFRPHKMESQDRTHVEPMLVLAAIAGRTDNLTLGTGSLIPYRHPIHAALSISSLSWLAGPDRVIAGWGQGTFNHEFAAIGLGDADRRELLEEHVRLIRSLWAGDEISHHGKYYSFEDVDVHPEPGDVYDIPMWYCGNSPAAVRRTIEWDLQGWMPGRINYATFEARVRRMRRLMDEKGEPTTGKPTLSAIPITSPDVDGVKGISKVNVEGIIAQASRAGWVAPDGSKDFSTAEDIAGAALCGSPDEIVEGVARYKELGMEHLVFDLRFRFDEWEELVRLLGEEVLPRVKKEL